MQHCKRIVPMCSKLSTKAIVPSRSIFSRRAIAPWNFIECQMEGIDRQFARMEREMNAAIREFGFPYARFRAIGEPSSHAPSLSSRLLPAIETETCSAPEESREPGKYIIKIDLGSGMSPDDIKINLKDRIVTVHAKLEEKSEDGNSRVYQEVTRSFSLPEGVNPEEVKSLLTSQGLLTIEIPLPKSQIPEPKQIPIKIENEAEK